MLNFRWDLMLSVRIVKTCLFIIQDIGGTTIYECHSESERNK
jgi:hypothetical protein